MHSMIIWCRGREQPGSVVHRPFIEKGELVSTSHPFLILREATHEEYMRQSENAGIDITAPEWEQLVEHDVFYYEVSTD